MGSISTLLRIILLYIILISGATFISYKANKKFEKCIAPYFAILILTLYIFGVFEILKIGVWIVSVLSIVLGLYAIIKDKKNIKERIITPGFMFFTIAFFILTITSFHKCLVDYDHYFYRSLNTKIMFYNDTISKGFDALYPPSSNLLEYFFLKVIGSYIQGIEAVALQMFSFALLLPLFDRKKQSTFLNFIITAIIILVPSILANLVFYDAAYPDAFLGLIIGYAMYTLCSEKINVYKVFCVSLILAVMTLTKPIGLYMAGIIIGMYLLAIILQKQNKNIKQFIKSKECKNIFIFIITLIITFGSWKVFVSINLKYNNNSSRDGSAQITGNTIEYLLKTTITTMFGYYDGEEHNAADANGNLIPKIYALVSTMGPVRLTLYGVITVLIVFVLLVYKFLINKEKQKQYINYMIALFIGLIVYVLLLQMAYLTKFSLMEMLDLAGLNRYLPTFILGIIYYMIACALDNMDEKDTKKINYLIMVAVILSFSYIVPIANVTITAGTNNIYTIEYTNNGRIPAKKIDEAIGENDEILIVSQDEDTNLFSMMIRYYLYPEHKTYLYKSIDKKTIEERSTLEEKRVENLKNTIITNNIPYIYVYSTNSYLNKIADNNISLKKETLYKIEIIGTNINLEEVKLTD